MTTADQPIFDRSRISHRQSKRSIVLQARIAAAQTSGDWQEMEHCLNESDEIFASILVSIPASWLIEGAPDNLDWSNPDSMNWLQQDRYVELIKLATPQAGAKGN